MNKLNSIELLKSVDIEINAHCNLSCSYCPNSQTGGYKQQLIDPQLFYKIIEQLHIIHFQARLSYHFYGEPLLHPQLPHYIQYVSKNLPTAKQIIFTNGTKLTLESFRELIQLGVRHIIVTKHEQTQQIPLERCLDELTELEQSKITIKGHEKIFKTTRGGAVPQVSDKNPINKICLVPMSNMVIDINGNIIPCFEDYHRTHIMGNLNNESLVDIWNKDKYKTFRSELRKGNRLKFDVCNKCVSNQIITL